MSKIQKAIDALDGCDEYSLRHHMSEVSILIEGYAEAQSELAALREELAKAKKLLSQARAMVNGATDEWHAEVQKIIGKK